MGLKTFRPITPSQRQKVSLDFSEITKSTPEKSLLAKRNRIDGRNSNGRITVRRRGGGHKRKYRIIDFKRDKVAIPAKVVGIEYDPNRSARIALLQYADGEKRYIIAPEGLVTGQNVVSGPQADIKVGNALPLADIPVGEVVHNIELRPGGGAKLCRSAGGKAQVMAKDSKYAQLRLTSGEQRMILVTCMATIGLVGNSDHSNTNSGKAGRSRWLGLRPKVRGVAMNPIDHPHGGGEGKTSGGRHPVSPWGTPAKGKKTRKNKRTDKFIIRGRKKK